ncbi:amidase [Helicosporidium sp. ATCC 50920]|nr:amidase [Helicosporidium sp. ATCC 50920]|eukprot:KDD76794.1 amidase [Helicosporidium sp. ATCC 50920]
MLDFNSRIPNTFRFTKSFYLDMGNVQSPALPPVETVTEASYDAKPIDAPVLTGRALKIFARLSESSLFSPLRYKLLRDNGLIQLLEETFIPDAPLFQPDLEGWPAEPSSPVEISARASSASRAVQAGQILGLAAPEGSTKATAERPTISDFHQAYLSGAASPRARASEARYRQGEPLSALDGVPFVVKDLVAVEGLPCSAGTGWLAEAEKEAYSARSASVVDNLLRAGALCVGKANLHEAGLGITGLNPTWGSVRNPRDPTRHSGGSSSGSAAAVAAGLVPFAVGSDGGGSIRIPAAWCGCVGLKTSQERCLGDGVVDDCWTVAVVGPMASCVADAALVYAVMAGERDEKEEAGGKKEEKNAAEVEESIVGQRDVPRPLKRITLYPSASSSSSSHPLQSLTIGVYSPWFDDAEPDVRDACRNALEILRLAGAAIEEVSLPEVAPCNSAHAATIALEMQSALGPLLRTSARVRRGTSCETRVSLSVVSGLSGGAYVNAAKLRRRATAHWRALFDVQGVHALATPCTPRLAPPIRAGALAQGESDLRKTTEGMRFVAAANFVGLPALAVPTGTLQPETGLPYSLQLVAPAWHEALLLKLGQALEERVPALPRPRVYWDVLAAPESRGEGFGRDDARARRPLNAGDGR